MPKRQVQAYTPASSASIAQAGMTRSTKNWAKDTASKPLEYGLASKGDTRLSDYKAQESFFHSIQTRYLTHIGSFPSVPALDEQFAALSSASNDPHHDPSDTSQPDISTLQNILMDMRKLREGLLASNRLDNFAKSAYLFIARAAILMSHPESYFPSIRHLLYVVHRHNPLSNSEVNELAGYLMLHLACSTNSYHDAYEVKVRFKLRDHRVETAVRALVANNYWLFWNTKRLVDGYKSKIMDRAAKDTRKHALKCIGATYHNVDVDFVERSTNKDWQSLKDEFAIEWAAEDGKVTIRKRSEAKTSTKVPARIQAANVTLKPTTETGLNTRKEVEKPRKKVSTTDLTKSKAEAPTAGLSASRWSTPKQEGKQTVKGGDSWTKWG